MATFLDGSCGLNKMTLAHIRRADDEPFATSGGGGELVKSCNGFPAVSIVGQRKSDSEVRVVFSVFSVSLSCATCV